MMVMIRNSVSLAGTVLLVALGVPSRGEAQTTSAPQDTPSFASRAMRTAVGVGGGALLGGWLGYFVSQVSRSDWERASTDERSHMRRQYAISGAAIGAIAGYFVRPGPTGIGRGPQPLSLPRRSPRQVLDSVALRRSIATNALEAVQLERPEWISGATTGEPSRVGPQWSSQLEAWTVVVYVGEERLGGIGALRDISLPEVAELRFFDPNDARRRWGLEHLYGAIEVVPVRRADAPIGAGMPGSGTSLRFREDEGR
jgi:hypothetical protein